MVPSVHIYVYSPKVKSHVYVENYFCACRPVGGQGGSIGTLTQLPLNARRVFFQTHVRKGGVISV